MILTGGMIYTQIHLTDAIRRKNGLKPFFVYRTMTSTLWSIVAYSSQTCETDVLAIGPDEQKIRIMFTKHISGETRAERYLSFSRLSLIRISLDDDSVTRETQIIDIPIDSLHWWQKARYDYDHGGE